MRICAVIPAAGKGTRLGMDVPKIFVPLTPDKTVWHVLRDLLLPHVAHIHLVLSPAAMQLFRPIHEQDAENARITASIQSEPRGMGDAIFGSQEVWRDYDAIMIVWGDQVNLSSRTIEETACACQVKATVVLPLTRQENPYVQYDFTGETLTGVRQSREHDQMDAVGKSDVGAFALSVDGVKKEWHDYLKVASIGKSTGEINFTPFIAYLSCQSKWRVVPVMVADDGEARGINTREDLEFARKRLVGATAVQSN